MRRAFFFIVAIAFANASFASIPRVAILDDAPAIDTPSAETRVWASDVLAPFERQAESELTRALRQGYEQASTTNASGLGRFLSVDPGKDWDPKQPQSWNMYAYVRNNPTNATDPTGKISYLVSRPTAAGKAHLFIVTHARYPGDPKAIIRSYGNTGIDGGRVDAGRSSRVERAAYHHDFDVDNEPCSARRRAQAQGGSRAATMNRVRPDCVWLHGRASPATQLVDPNLATHERAEARGAL